MKLILVLIYLVIVAVVFFVCGYKCGVRNLTSVIDKKIAELLKEQEDMKIYIRMNLMNYLRWINYQCLIMLMK